MLYCNKHLESEEREMDFGKIYQIGMGEVGRGRKFMALTCPEGTIVKSGMNPEYTIGRTKSGRPRVIRKKDGELYMMLSAKGGYTRRGDGTIKVLEGKKNDFEVLARGNGADGAAGRIGFWDCVLLKVPTSDAIVRVRTSGAGYGTPSDLYVIHNGQVYHCTLDELEVCCETLGIEVPCKIKNEERRIMFDEYEWITL